MKISTITKFMVFAFVASILFSCNTQTNNPRGIYKLKSIVGRFGEVASPYDQYKICSDSITLSLFINRFDDNRTYFTFNNQDPVLYYTGEQHDDKNDKNILTYNVSETSFTHKWWCELKNHYFFPDSSWVIENYESGLYSYKAKPIIETLTTSTKEYDNNPLPLIGTWSLIGHCTKDTTYTNESLDKQIERILSYYDNNPSHSQIRSFTPSYVLDIWISNKNSSGYIYNTDYIENYAYESYYSGSYNIEVVEWYKEGEIFLIKLENTPSYEVWIKDEGHESLLSFMSSMLLE